MNTRFVIALLCFVSSMAAPGLVRADLIQVFNTAQINVPDVGVADPYPSTITVAGVTGQVTNFTVTLTGVNHSFSDDLSAAIVSPNGTAVLLFSGPGANFQQSGRKNVFNLNWTFDDNAADTLPETTQPVSGTFRPGLFNYDDTFPTPGPGATYGFNFSPYLTENLNGQWNLYVMDSNSGDSGFISGGWSVAITFNPTAVPEPSTMALFGLVGCAGAVKRFWRRRQLI